MAIQSELTVRSLVEQIGQDVVEKATGADARTVRRWKAENEIPPRLYVAMKEAAKRDLPTSLFGFR